MVTILGFAAQAQTQPVMLPGKIAVFKAGDPSGVYPINSSKVQPCFVQVFDPVTNNQATPLLSVALSTNVNVPGSVWINAHAGSEGGGISRSMDRSLLALEGYTGNILSPTAAKPSSAAGVTRGIVTLDAFTNAISVYSDPAAWFGLPPGVTQNNPTGIATTDGQSFWGTGNVTGSGTTVETSGTLFYNSSTAPQPVTVQNYIQAAAEARIIGGTLYIVVPGAGVYNFVGTTSSGLGGQVIPRPYDPTLGYQQIAATNMFLPTGKYTTVANFDMNPSATVAYCADQTYGIVKFTNNAGPNNPVWVQAPYYFSSTNIGTLAQPASQQGCFGICVDFSGPNPVIYATTMEQGTGIVGGNSQGNADNNRLIRIVDTGINPGTTLVAQTLATAPTKYEAFRGIDFTPDLRPLITSQPANNSSTVHANAGFSLTASSVYALYYQWYQESGATTNALVRQTNATLTVSNLTVGLNGTSYQCVVSNVYGVVTSTPAILTVTTTAVLPSITNAVAYLTNYIAGTVTFSAILPNGTQPFTYQWYQGSTPLSDANPSASGATYSGSTNNTLTISGLGTSDAGNYYLAVTNDAGGILKLVDVLSVQFQPPVIGIGGQPQSLVTFSNLTATLTVTPSAGTQPLNYQWYLNGVPLTDPGANNNLSGSQSSGNPNGVLTISPAGLSDSGSYTVVVSNDGGSVTSAVATVSVLIPPAPSYVGYSNQVYLQTFDTLPDPGSNSVNSINNPIYAGKLAGVTYSLANPFDFAYPVIGSSYVGGLGLAGALSGWYGAADTLYTGVGGYTRFGAQDGDQSTGGVIDFGLNDSGSLLGTNRALGLLSTSTTGSTTYALKLVNTSGTTLNYVNLAYLGELWRNGTTARTLTFGYSVDNTATNFVLSAQSISTNATLVPSLAFSFPTAAAVTVVDGSQPQNQVKLSSSNLQLATPWTPGGSLWLIWSVDFYGAGSGNGYAIDNLSFSASVNPLAPVSSPTLGGVTYNTSTGLSFTFTNTAGAASQFTTWSTTNLTLPFSQWVNLGHPSEVTPGNYQVVDPSSKTNKQTFYKVTSP